MQINQEDWERTVQLFQAAGGILENVALRAKDGERGLFAANADYESRIYLPRNLLIPTEDVIVHNGMISLKEETKVDPIARAFFEEYNQTTSWGGGGKEQIHSFFLHLQSLPKPCIDLLSKTFGMATSFSPLTEEFILSQFLRSRRIGIDGIQYLMPILELCNHNGSGGSVSISKEAVSISGKFENEITWKYRMSDTFQMFRSYSYVSTERFAFSLPFEVTDKRLNKLIRVGSNTSNRNRKETNFLVPEISVAERTAEISFVQLGDRLDPRNGPRIFLSHIAPKLEVNAVEFFEGLLHYNRQSFLDLLETAESEDSYICREIRKVARLQLEGLNMVSFQ
jgi:hypothetical protein